MIFCYKSNDFSLSVFLNGPVTAFAMLLGLAYTPAYYDKTHAQANFSMALPEPDSFLVLSGHGKSGGVVDGSVADNCYRRSAELS